MLDTIIHPFDHKDTFCYSF